MLVNLAEPHPDRHPIFVDPTCVEAVYSRNDTSTTSVACVVLRSKKEFHFSKSHAEIVAEVKRIVDILEIARSLGP